MRPSFEGAFRAVRSYAVGSVYYNGFSSRTGTTFPSSGRKRPGFFTARGTPSLSQSLALPLILRARSCGHPPRKHNLKSHLAAHANPALEAQTALWCGRPPTKTRAQLHTCRRGTCQSCGRTRRILNPGRGGATFARLLALLFAPPS